MPRGYWIAHVEVRDADAYRAYVEGAKGAFEAAGARFLARGGRFEELEGALGRSRHVIVEFPSLEAAEACWRSETYQAARAHRLPVSEASIVLVEGAEGAEADPPGSAVPPGYWTAHVAVTDAEAYGRYRKANAAPFAAHGARFLARAGRHLEMEGALGRERHVLIAFPDFDSALACWRSDGYAAARAERHGAGTATITAVEGLA